MESRPDFRKSVAVVVGINAYDHGVPPLRTATADARRLAQLLADEHGYAVHLLLDGEATREALTDLLTVDLPATVGADDRVLFYFAGHGVAVEGDDGPSGYLLLHDARRGEHETYLPMPALYDALNALPCRHLLAILDSCFAGAFRWSATRDMVDLPAVIHQERYDRFILDPAWQAIASASHDQKALDQLPASGALTSFADFGTRGDGGVHSPFAAALIEALEGAGDVVPAGGGDGVITATELYLYLEQRLQPATIEAGYRQTPRLWPLAKHDKGEFIFLAPGHELNLPPAPELTYENNPWLGLRSYDEGDEALFFGRESVVATLADYVEEHPLTVVLGASGTGKSSVVKAGLVPQLKRDTTQAWRVLPIVRPGPAPMQALERAVAELESEGGIEERIAAWCAAHPGDRLVLVVDQFEELVTLVRSADEREAVLGLLARLVEGHPDRLRLVLTLRSDFEPQFDRTALEMHWKQARFVVPPMSQADLRGVIERPASERVMYFKPAALVDDLIDEVIQTPGGLPLLSFALSEMYVHYVRRYADGETDDRALEVEDYAAVGGVVGALRARAEAEYGALDAAHRESMRRVMLRMVAAEGGTVARRRVAPSELDYPDPAETERVRTVVRQLTAARLLVEGQGEDGEAYVEPAHDALVRAWDRLIGWLHAEEDRTANLRLQQNMAQAAREWERTEDQKAKAGLLWRDASRGALLAQLVTQEERRLDAKSLTVGQRLRRRLRLRGRTRDGAQGAWMNRRELAFARRSIRRRRNIRLGLSVTVLVVVATAITATALGFQARKNAREALDQRDEAIRQTRIGLSNQAAAQAVFALEGDNDATQAFKLAAAALDFDSTNASARRTLARALYGEGIFMYRGLPYARPFYRDVQHVGIDNEEVYFELIEEPEIADSKASLEAGQEHFVVWWSDHGSGRSIGARSPSGIYGGHEFEDDGSLGPFVLRSRNGERIGSLPGQEDWAFADFTSDGRYLVTGSSDGAVVLWKMPSNGQGGPRTPLLRLGYHPGGWIRAVKFSEDETRIIASYEGPSRIWALTEHPLKEIPLSSLTDILRSHPHMRNAKDLGWMGAVPGSGSEAPPDFQHGAEPGIHATTAAGTRIALVLPDSTLRILDATGKIVAEQRLPAGLSTLAFLPDARSLLSVSDGVVQLRDSLGSVTVQRAVGRIDGRAYPAGENGRLALFQRGDSVLTVDLTDGTQRGLAGRLPQSDFSVSADGALAVVALNDTVGVLNAETGKIEARLYDFYFADDRGLWISPDGEQIYVHHSIWTWRENRTTRLNIDVSEDRHLASNGLLALQRRLGEYGSLSGIGVRDDEGEIISFESGDFVAWLASGRVLAAKLGEALQSEEDSLRGIVTLLPMDPLYLKREAWGGAEPLSAAERDRWDIPDPVAFEESQVTPSSFFSDLMARLGLRRAGPRPTESDASVAESSIEVGLRAWAALDSLAALIDPDTYSSYTRMLTGTLQGNGLALLEKLSGEPIFLEGPHGRGGFDSNSTEFSKYNPRFVEWALRTLLPPQRKHRLADTAQPIYDRLLRGHARMYWLVKTELERRPELVARALAEGTAAEDPGARMNDIFQPWADSLLRTGPLRYASRHSRDFAHAAAFWVRREHDETRPVFADGLDTLIQRFDADWAWAQTRRENEEETRENEAELGAMRVWSMFDADETCDYKQSRSYLDFGVRALYCTAYRTSAVGIALQHAGAGVPVFLSGPHDGPRLNLEAPAEFGHYNPAFVQWATETLIPDSTDGLSYTLSREVYRSSLREEARAYWLALRALDAHPDAVERIKEKYLRQPDPLDYLNGAVSELTENGDILQPPARGFWIRREMDGSKDAFTAGLRKLLATFDPDFLRRYPRTVAP